MITGYSLRKGNNPPMKHLILSVFLFPAIAGIAMPITPEKQSPPGAAANDPADIWAPWRKTVCLTLLPYQACSEPVKIIPMANGSSKTAVFPEDAKILPLKINLANCILTETDGVEISFSFRVGRLPPARLKASHSLAQFSLKGKSGSRSFWLHAYSGNSGFCLNGIVPFKKESMAKILLCRGAANPQSSPRWDTQWHTVRLAWCEGQFAATWDGLPVLHAADAAAPYRELILEWVKPGESFGTLELTPIEVRAVKFDKLP